MDKVYHSERLRQPAREARLSTPRRRTPVSVREDPREHFPKWPKPREAASSQARSPTLSPSSRTQPSYKKRRTRRAWGPEAGPGPAKGDQRRRGRAPREVRALGPARGARRGGKARPGGRGVRRGRGQEPHRRSPEAGAAADPQLLGRMRFRVSSEGSRERRWPGGAKSKAPGEWAAEAVVAAAAGPWD